MEMKAKRYTSSRTDFLRNLRKNAGASSPISLKAVESKLADVADLSSKAGAAKNPGFISRIANVAKGILPNIFSGKGLLLALGVAALFAMAGPTLPLLIGGGLLASRLGVLSKLAPLALNFLPFGGGLRGLLVATVLPKILPGIAKIFTR